MLIYNIHAILNITRYEPYQPIYIKLQETIVGKYLNIVHTYIHFKQMNTISTSKRIYITYIHQNVQVQQAERLWRKPMSRQQARSE